MKLLQLGFALGVALLLGAEDKKDPLKEELSKLEGSWNIVALESDGQNVFDQIKDVKFTFKGTDATVAGEFPDQDKYAKFSFKIDAETTPKCIDITLTAGDDKGVKFEGIYEVEKDKLRMCIRVLGKDRPTEFATKENSRLVLITLERAKMQ